VLVVAERHDHGGLHRAGQHHPGVPTHLDHRRDQGGSPATKAAR
jgi:hypothetical protein